MRLEIYAPRDSAVHGLHPATKFGLLVVALAAPFLTTDLAAQALALAAAFAAAAAGRVLRVVLGPWKLLAFIFAVTFVLWGVFGAHGPGEALRDLSAASRSARASLAYALRVTAIFVFGLAFLATTRTEETIHALGTFRVPFRVAFALGLAFRLVPLFLTSAGSILDAQRARGLDLRSGSLAERLRKYVPVLVPIFMTALRNADQMAMALDARGFGAPGPRTRLRRYSFRAADVLALIIGSAYLGLFFALRGTVLAAVPQ